MRVLCAAAGPAASSRAMAAAHVTISARRMVSTPSLMALPLRMSFRKTGIHFSGTCANPAAPIVSCFGWKPGVLPGEDAARKVRSVVIALVLCRQRRRHRAPAGTAGEDHLAPLRVGNRRRVEIRK